MADETVAKQLLRFIIHDRNGPYFKELKSKSSQCNFGVAVFNIGLRHILELGSVDSVVVAFSQGFHLLKGT